MLFDNVKIELKAGHGGNGCVAFHREKYVSHGGPDGGDGGNGASIIFKVDEGQNTLTYYKYKRKFVAENGGDGQNRKFHGANGKDLYLPVPPGTVVKDAESGLVIVDMSTTDEYRICKGGNGGWGNRHFATATRQIPNFARNGRDGQERTVVLELKMMADVGLIGFPNVGKSSLLSTISSAHPKIADYHFTTLEPSIGVVEVAENAAFVAADIPGLIEGASEGAGLGLQFLRHVQRCRLLIHLVDITGKEGRDPIDDIMTINYELEQFDPELAKRPQIIAANKCDLLEEDADLTDFEDYIKVKGYDLVYISVATGKNVRELVNLAYKKLQDLPPIKVYDAEFVDEEPVIDKNDHSVTVTKEDGKYIVEGEWLFHVMQSVNFEDRQSLMFFQRVLKNYGVIDELEKAGCTDGDTVSLYDFEFDFIK